MKMLLSMLLCSQSMANDNMECAVVDYYTVRVCHTDVKTKKVICKNVRTPECLKYVARSKHGKSPATESEHDDR
jgi:hypothetical protein